MGKVLLFIEPETEEFNSGSQASSRKKLVKKFQYTIPETGRWSIESEPTKFYKAGDVIYVSVDPKTKRRIISSSRK